MKKLILLIALTGFTVLAKAQSQDFHAFKFDLGLGYAIPTNSGGDGLKGGVTLTLQPHYRITDDLAVGFRMEAAAIGYENKETEDVKVSALVSGCFSGEYYFLNGGFRPFIGAGFGLFDEESGVGDTDSVTLSARTQNFGAYPEVGFEAGHFRMSAEYDIAGHNNNYVAFKIGSFFGGGKKR